MSSLSQQKGSNLIIRVFLFHNIGKKEQKVIIGNLTDIIVACYIYFNRFYIKNNVTFINESFPSKDQV